MRHDITVEGPAFRLRPVEVADAAFIVGLRTDRERARFLHPISGRVADQEAYIERYLARDADYYFIVEQRRDAAPVGTVGVYDVDAATRVGVWGRWVLRARSLAAVESAWLVYRVAFERLGLRRVFCQTVAENTRVVSFHDSCGLMRNRALPFHFRLGETLHDAVEHVLEAEGWPRVEALLGEKAAFLARRLGA